jgi:two-component system chemotaxis family response regulator WspR
MSSPASDSPLAPPLAEQNAMVFLVDDQPMVSEAIRRALVDEPDISYHYCADYANAVARAAEMRPTVILQDLVMPNVDGLQLVEAFRLNPATKDIPIIVLSSKEDARIKSAAFAAGANDYLVKLPDRIELVARVRYHSRAHLLRLQRDEAYRALRDSQRQLAERVQELEAALSEVKTLQGMLPICCYCKKIRDTGDYWHEVEAYIDQRADVSFSHGVCPECHDRAVEEMTRRRTKA